MPAPTSNAALLTEPLIRCLGLVKRHPEGEGQRLVLDGLDLTVERGEIIALLGRSGTGKSTLLNLLGGLDTPDSGQLTVCGADLVAADERQRTRFRREHVGFVFQSFNLVPTLTVAENVLLRVDLLGLDVAARARALERLEFVGLGARAQAWPDRLSGGEQQRVAIAAALAGEPELVLADEPTGNLDPENAREVIRLLEGTTRALRRTMVVATHASDVAAIADRVYAVHEGRLEVVRT